MTLNKQTLLMWLAVFISAFILDSIGHILLTGGFVEKELAGVLRSPSEINMLPITFEYITVSVGIVYFLIQTKALSKPVSYSAFLGALLGLMIYGIYGLINFTFLVKWSFNVVIIDTIIGVVVLALSASLGRLVGTRYSK